MYFVFSYIMCCLVRVYMYIFLSYSFSICSTFYEMSHCNINLKEMCFAAMIFYWDVRTEVRTGVLTLYGIDIPKDCNMIWSSKYILILKHIMNRSTVTSDVYFNIMFYVNYCRYILEFGLCHIVTNVLNYLFASL